MTAPQSALVTITAVRETLTRYQDVRRFLIDAARTTDDPEGGQAFKYLGLTTLDPWKASMCEQARQTGQTLSLVYRDTGYFDKDLLSVEFATQEEHV